MFFCKISKPHEGENPSQGFISINLSFLFQFPDMRIPSEYKTRYHAEDSKRKTASPHRLPFPGQTPLPKMNPPVVLS